MDINEKKNLVKRWRETGEIPEGCYGSDKYFSPPGGISVDELDTICDQLNEEWEAQDSGLRVYWSAGEFLPAFVEQRQLPI